MNAFDEASRSIWMDTVVADAPPLDESIHADTVVVGSGITGLSTAYELACRGRKVVVLDRGRIGGGMTSRTSAHLTSLSDDGFETLIRVHGLQGAKTFYASHAAAIDRMEEVAGAERIECRFRRVDGYLFPAIGKDPSEELDAQLKGAKKVGMPIERCSGLPLKGLENVAALRYPSLAAFHPLRYLRGLADAIIRRGGRLFANTMVTQIEENGGAVTVRTANDLSVEAADAVVATNSPINNRFKLHSQMAPYRTYVMAMSIERDSLEDALYWDTLDPYHYVRIERGRGSRDYVIVGGADHKTGEADDAWARFEGLESWIRALLPRLGNVTHRWSGQTLEPVDYAAFSGRNPGDEHIFVHTGDSGQGLTHGVAGSLLISRLIVGEPCEWTAFYDPARVRLAGAKNFVAENIMAVTNLAQYLAPGELQSVDELKPGTGAIIRQGLTKIAAYRDENGALHQRSAACTHLGCHIHWNSLERCWDCPCHGSHFAVDGTALNAPAIDALGEVSDAAEEDTVPASRREAAATSRS
jgi:glycine/D-amino acid oxidase-like deaminating enzyme/nitrite reductase/ring-hydroxylating ferredoxin subunit